MTTSTQKRIARLSGLLLLALLVVALAVPPAAQAMRDVSASVPASAGSATINALQLPTLAQVRQHQGVGSATSAGSGTINAQQFPTLAQVQQHQGVGSATSAGSGTISVAQRPTQAQLQRAHGAFKGPSVASGGGTTNAQIGLAWGYQYSKLGAPVAQAPASSGTSATTVWIVAAAVAGVLLIGGWVFLRRRRQLEGVRACELSAEGC